MTLAQFLAKLLFGNLISIGVPIVPVYPLDEAAAVEAAKRVPWDFLIIMQATIADSCGIKAKDFIDFPNRYPDPGRVPDWWDTL